MERLFICYQKGLKGWNTNSLKSSITNLILLYFEVSWNLTKMKISINYFLGHELYYIRVGSTFFFFFEGGVGSTWGLQSIEAVLVRWVQMKKPMALRNIHCSPQFSMDLNAENDSGPHKTQNGVV